MIVLYSELTERERQIYDQGVSAAEGILLPDTNWPLHFTTT